MKTCIRSRACYIYPRSALYQLAVGFGYQATCPVSPEALLLMENGRESRLTWGARIGGGCVGSKRPRSLEAGTGSTVRLYGTILLRGKQVLSPPLAPTLAATNN